MAGIGGSCALASGGGARGGAFHPLLASGGPEILAHPDRTALEGGGRGAGNDAGGGGGVEEVLCGDIPTLVSRDVHPPVLNAGALVL